MELPRREKHDLYTRPGQYNELENRLRNQYVKADLPVLVMYAFDYRTRLGPFLFTDKTLLPAGPRAVAGALYSAGFKNLRIVLQEWTPNVLPSRALVGGKPPALLFISSMQIHSASAKRLVIDAHRLGKDRPLILAGGAKAIYEPWDFFGLGAEGQYSADVVVTGEEFVILELLERLSANRADGESMLDAFRRCRREGLLEDIPGLVFREDDAEDRPPQRLINTGIQRLVQDLDELPMPTEALRFLEPPHQRSWLARRPLELDQIQRHATVLSLVTTHGCKFHCPYCPIPAYNQFTFRFKSPGRLVREITEIAQQTGIATFFGTDDNFFNNRETVEDTFGEMARSKIGRQRFRDAVFFGTEGTEFDVFKNQDLLPLARDAGLRGIWFGIEDMTAELVKKGQSPEKTHTLFKMLRKLGIAPMPMMMHHDGQPLWSWRNLYGLLNQVRFLRRAGAVSMQVTILTPSIGSKGYEDPFRNQLVMSRVGGVPIEDFQYDGNYCIATEDPHPWRKQLNMFLAYASFYNPVNFLKTSLKIDSLWAYRVTYQLYGMMGVVRSLNQAKGWLYRLVNGPIERFQDAPMPRFEMLAPAGVETRLLHYQGV